MGFFAQLFHRLSTGPVQPPDAEPLARLQVEVSALTAAFAALTQDYDDHTEKISKKLESYRARSQPRKGGRFAPEDGAESPKDGSSIVDPTHEDIERLARSRGIIR